MRVPANTLNKQPLTAEKGWPSSFGVGRGGNKPLAIKMRLLRNFSVGLGLILLVNDLKFILGI
jgi:hypothetical protein